MPANIRLSGTAIRLFCAAGFLLLFSPLRGQSLEQSTIDRLSSRSETLTKRGMLVLGGWATGNIVSGAILAPASTGSRKHFYNMNMFWNGINLGIAGWGYFQSGRSPRPMNRGEAIKAQFNTEKTLLFNAGLDVAYVMGGLYLIERSNSSSGYAEELRGYGNSVVLQGAFLFIFDLALHWAHTRNHFLLEELLAGVRISERGIGLRISL